ncbi:UNVERIFIED_CONTAM: Myosin light chain kinase [Trichonephila clavipes]
MLEGQRQGKSEARDRNHEQASSSQAHASVGGIRERAQHDNGDGIICDGVSYMHKNNVLHLDLKPENILCKTRTSHKIKIIDFGLARIYKQDESLRILFGTPEFVAPEVINYEPVCPSSDMWSVGVICYVL